MLNNTKNINELELSKKIWEFFRKNDDMYELDSYNCYFIFTRAYYNNEKLESTKKVSNDSSVKLIFEKLDNDYGESINQIIDRFSESELYYITSNPKLIFETMSNRWDNIYVKPFMMELACQLLDANENDIIFNPYSRQGEFTNYVHTINSNIFVESVDSNPYKNIVSLLSNSLISDEFNIRSKDPIKESDTDLLCNKLFCLLDMGNRMNFKIEEIMSNKVNAWLEENRINRYDSLIYVVKNLLELERLEKAIYMIPTGKLFNHLDKDTLNNLVNNGFIEAIIQLPEKTMETTSISFCLLIVSKNNDSVKFIDASEEYTKQNRTNIIESGHISKIVDEYKHPDTIGKVMSIEEIKENDYILVPQRIVIPEHLDLDNYYLLKDIANIQRGAGRISRKELETRFTQEQTKIKYLESSDIGDFLDYSQINNLKNIEPEEEKYLAEANDIVLAKVQNFKSMIIENKDDLQILLSGNLYRLVIDSSIVNPYYVAAYLETDHAKNQIMRLMSGTVTMMLPVKSLEEIKIPKVDKEEEELIVSNYKNIKRKIKITHQQLILLNDQKNEIFGGVL